MLRKMALFISIAVTLSATPSFVSIANAYQDDQSIQAQINADGSANGTWTIPVNSSTGTYLFPELQNFGSTGLMNYHLKSIANESGTLTLNPYPGGYTVNLPPNLNAVTALKAQYDVSSALTK